MKLLMFPDLGSIVQLMILQMMENMYFLNAWQQVIENFWTEEDYHSLMLQPDDLSVTIFLFSTGPRKLSKSFIIRSI